MILVKTKTIPNFNKLYNLASQYDFYYGNYLLSDELDIFYKSENYDYTTYKYNKKFFFNDVEITSMLKGKLGQTQDLKPWEVD